MTEMALGMSERVRPIHESVAAMVRDEIMPLDAEFLAEVGRDGDRWAYTKRQVEILEGLKATARERGLWNFWLTGSRARLWPHHRRIRLSRRGDGQGASRRRDLQLLGARHRQHGGAGALRLGRAQAALAGAAARRQDPLGLSDDRARRCLVRRHQYRDALRAGRRRLCAQRREMVGVGCRRPALRDLHRHGQDRRRRAEAPAAFDDPGAVRYQRHHPAEADEGLWRRRRAARPHASRLRQMCACPGTI